MNHFFKAPISPSLVVVDNYEKAVKLRSMKGFVEPH